MKRKKFSAVLFAAMVSFGVMSVASADTLYEAEDGKLGNGEVWIGDSDNASGGKYVGGIDPSEGYARHLELTVQVPEDGEYEAEISYANGGNEAILAIIVNGEEQAEVKTPPTPGGWANFGSGIAKVKLTLKKGENSVKLANKDQYTQVDYLKVLGDGAQAAAETGGSGAAIPAAMPKTGLGGEAEANGKAASAVMAAAVLAGAAVIFLVRRRKTN